MKTLLEALPVVVPYDSAGGDPLPGGAFGTDRHIFTKGGQPWRYKGVSAFKLAKLYEQGQDIDPFLDDYDRANLFRVWNYTPAADWGAEAWGRTAPEVWVNFLRHLGGRGKAVSLTLLTDDDVNQLDPAAALLEYLAGYQFDNLLIEIGNEPETHKAIDTAALLDDCNASGYCYASGNYEDSNKAFGTHLMFHVARTDDWPRRAHDGMEFYDGGGPNAPTDPAHHCPTVSDEPPKAQDVNPVAKDWRAHFGTCAILCGGATFHSETGKFAERMTDQERTLFAAAMDGLEAFPATEPNAGGYRRIVEPGNEPGGPTEHARTYVVGSSMVRCQQTGTAAPEAGWISLDADGVLWRR